MATNLSVYLNDHLAGAAGALEILERLKASEPADWVAALEHDIEDDRVTLMRFMKASGIAISELRQGAGWIGEKLLALKTRLDDPSNGALRTLEILDALAIGIDGKQALWQSISALPPAASARGDVLDLPRLVERAERQRNVVEQRRLAAARRAFADD